MRKLYYVLYFRERNKKLERQSKRRGIDDDK